MHRIAAQPPRPQSALLADPTCNSRRYRMGRSSRARALGAWCPREPGTAFRLTCPSEVARIAVEIVGLCHATSCSLECSHAPGRLRLTLAWHLICSCRVCLTGGSQCAREQ